MPTQGALFKRENPQCPTSEFWALTWETTTFSTRPLQNWEKHRAFSGETLQASSGRSQICYVSGQDRPKKVHLVFESGEVSNLFYLFAGGPDWIGSDLCVKSNLVTENLSVASGLRLGQTPDEVKAILGKPSAVIGNKVIYSFAFEKKTSSSDFDKLRQQHPELSDEDLHRNYELYSIGVYIEARFTQSKLSYLSVSKAETY